MNNKDIVNRMENHKCSRCGDCCGLFIPFTEKELSVIRAYVKQNNIKPHNRLDMNGQFNARCCFYNEIEKKCDIYEVRPYVCKDFKCDRKNWKSKRDSYEKRAKYNSSLSKKQYMATFDDLIYKDYEPILRFILNLLPNNIDRIDDSIVLALFKNVGRLDLLNYFEFYDENNIKHKGTELLNN